MLFTLALVLAAATAPAPPALPSNCAKATAFVGTICTPPTPGKHPAILLLGGSEGGDTMSYAAAPRFAKRGYVAASVAYFGLPGLPASLENIPVETVGRALDDISKRPDVDSMRIAILGDSKGGEFALLAASTYPQIHAVVADVPSPFAWQGIPQGPVTVAQSSWTMGGKPLPFVAYSPKIGEIYQSAFTQGAPLDIRAGYDDSMQRNHAQIAPAMFHLENIRGPVMMLAADDDQIWDSVAQANIGMTYLREHHHPYGDVYVHYPGAGHMFLFSAPGRALTDMPIGPVKLVFGGTPQANIDAGRLAWARIDAFLDAALQNHA